MATSLPSLFGSSSNLELVRVAREMAEQKGLQFNDIIAAVEESIKVVAQKQYGKEHLKVEVNPSSGETVLYKAVRVIGSYDEYDVDDGYMHALLEDIKDSRPGSKAGDIYYIPIENAQFGRTHVQSVRHNLISRINDIERDKQYAEYGERVGDMIFGLVKRVEQGSIVVEHNGNELCMPLNQVIGSEVFRSGDRIKACIDKVRRVKSGPQVLLSRSCNSFLLALLKQEIPEVYDGIVTVHAIARIPGARSKVAVYSSDPNVDAVGSCIGRRGMRINNVSKELCGEKVDVVVYSEDLVTFVINALVPAEITKVVIDEAAHRIEVVSAESKLSLAIGKGGVNVRLASRLLGWDIDILSEDMETKKRVDEFNFLTSELARALDVEDIIAQILLAEGYGSVDELALSPIEDVAKINGFNDELAAQLVDRAKKHVESRDVNGGREDQKDTDMPEDLGALLVDCPRLRFALKRNGVKTLDGLSDLSIDDVIDIVGDPESLGITREVIGDLVLRARKACGLFGKSE